MADKKPSGDSETPAEAFLKTAHEYHLAATTLLSIQQQVESPLYYLYAHSIELCLKAYLRSYELPTPLGKRGHALGALLDQCQGKGLSLRTDVRNVIRLLESEHRFHGFRYFVFRATSRPEINYLREVADELIQVVSEEVGKGATPGPSKAVLKFTVGKPEKK
jgi:hypothetical protein